MLKLRDGLRRVPSKPAMPGISRDGGRRGRGAGGGAARDGSAMVRMAQALSAALCGNLLMRHAATRCRRGPRLEAAAAAARAEATERLGQHARVNANLGVPL